MLLRQLSQRLSEQLIKLKWRAKVQIVILAAALSIAFPLNFFAFRTRRKLALLDVTAMEEWQKAFRAKCVRLLAMT